MASCNKPIANFTYTTDQKVAPAKVQFDNQSDTVGVNSRLNWIFSPGRELFLVVNPTIAREFDSLIAEDYVLIYLHGATQRSCMPSFGWLKRCYQMVDRRLRKNLKGLYLVHPTFWVKTIVALTRPFIR